MSLVHDYHDERKARLVRLGARECPGCAVLRKSSDAHVALIAEQVRELADQLALIVVYKGKIETLESARDGGAATEEAYEPTYQAANASGTVRTVLDIVLATCRHFGMSYADIISPRRDMASVLPRQISMYLAKKLTTRSLPEIGRRIGDRDHTTVLHAVRKIEGLVERGHAVAVDIDVIRTRLGMPS